MSEVECKPRKDRAIPNDAIDGFDDNGGVGMDMCVGVIAIAPMNGEIEVGSAMLGDCKGEDWTLSRERLKCSAIMGGRRGVDASSSSCGSVSTSGRSGMMMSSGFWGRDSPLDRRSSFASGRLSTGVIGGVIIWSGSSCAARDCLMADKRIEEERE